MVKVVLNGMLLAGSFSGVQRAIWELARSLSQTGSGAYTFVLPWDAQVEGFCGERFFTRRVACPGRVRLLRILWEHVRLPQLALREEADLIHAPGYVGPLCSRVPTVVTLYDVLALVRPEWCTRLNACHYRMLLPISARRAAGIIVPSEQTRRDVLASMPQVRVPLAVIPLGVGKEFRRLEDSRTLVAARERYARGRSFILSVGRIEPKKNFLRLVEAFAELRRAGISRHLLLLVGPWAWDGPRVRRRIRQLGLEQEVVLTGSIPDADLIALYNLADVFVFPSLFEGFGMPPLEAMACGTPVVASQRAALPETVGDAALWVDPDDVGALAGAIRAVIENQALRRNLIAGGLRHSASFSWEKTAERTEAFYRDILRVVQPTAP